MSDYPRIMYHSDGHTAVASSAHHEQTEFGGAEWSRTPSAKHLRDPGDGLVNTLAPAVAQTTPAPKPRHQDAPGPVSASDVRAIVGDLLAAHPGLQQAAKPNEVQPSEAGADPALLQSLHTKLDHLMQQLGVQAPSESTGEADAVGDTENTTRRRGRGRGASDNRLTGAAGDQE